MFRYFLPCICNNNNNINHSHNNINSIDIEWKNTVPFIPPITSGKVIKVYDGDTITIATKLPFKDADELYRFSIRLIGIDAPEIKGETANERHLAIIARDALSKLILNKEVILKNKAIDKYGGRLLADVFYNNVHVNKWLLEQNYAIPYNGKTKIRPIEWV